MQRVSRSVCKAVSISRNSVDLAKREDEICRAKNSCRLRAKAESKARARKSKRVRVSRKQQKKKRSVS